MKKTRVRLKQYEALALGLEVSNGDIYGNQKYYLNVEQAYRLDEIRNFHNSGFTEVKRTLNKDGEVISKIEKLVPDNLISIPENHEIKRVSTNVSTKQQWVITEPIKKVLEIEKEIDFLSIFKDKIKPIKIYFANDLLPGVALGCLFDRAIYTDVHVGMNVNKDGFSLYDGLWNEIELFKRLETFVNYIIKNQKSDTLFLNDLGDFMDGWDGFTTRGGHALPQNMDNQKAFDVGLRFKIQMIDALFKSYSKIKIVNICNDNHAGSFGYIVNSAFKTYIELKYPDNIEVINQR